MICYDDMEYFVEDKRTRRFVLPKKAVPQGTVDRPENLLCEKDLQIGFFEPSITVLKNGEDGNRSSVTLDFGREMHGGIRIINFGVTGAEYPTVQITFGESFEEAQGTVGEKGATNDHAVRQFSVPVPRFSDQEWGQTGFRFVKIELLDKNTTLAIKSVLGVSVMHDIKYLGDFECSDETLNKIYSTAAYTCHLCLQNMVWDGIKRDRLVWIGDMMPESMTVRSVFGALPIVEESLDFIRRQTPLPNWMNNFPSYSMWWVMILYDWYMSSGNREFLNTERDYLFGLLEQFLSLVDQEGNMCINERIFLDWPTNANPAKVGGVTALFKMSLESGAKLCEILGNKDLSEKCMSAANRLLCDTDANGAKQVSAFLALSGFKDLKTAAKEIMTDGDRGFSTFLSYFILKTLVLAGNEDEAVSLLCTYYGRMLNKGATSFWEDYNVDWDENSSDILSAVPEGVTDIHGDCGQYCYNGFRHSFCHGWSSGVLPFLSECVLGVNIVKEGCKAVKITPHLGSLSWVKGAYPTPYGIIKIEHKRMPDGSIESKISAPDEVEIIK